ncbi:MAG: hypothetical protein RL660_820 [Bacteroidota bacterium]
MRNSINAFSKLASYILPINLAKSQSAVSGTISVDLLRGELMLCADKACYSFGKYYNPFKHSFRYAAEKGWRLPQNFLLLGAGMLSALRILQHNHQHLPQQTSAVELDAKVIAYAKQFVDPKLLSQTNLIQADAVAFMATHALQHDCIAVDVYVDMDIPQQVTSPAFLERCKQCLATQGYIIYNAYFKDAGMLEAFRQNFEQVFPSMEAITWDVNTFFIARIA